MLNDLLSVFSRLDISNDFSTIQQLRENWKICDIFDSVEDALQAMKNNKAKEKTNEQSHALIPTIYRQRWM